MEKSDYVDSLGYLIEEGNKCLQSKLYLACFYICLTLPDICGKIEFPTENCTTRYTKWFDAYVGSLFDTQNSDQKEKYLIPYLTGEICYKLRCSMLHEGTNNLDEKYKINEFELSFEKSVRIGCASALTTFDEKGNKIPITRSLEVNVPHLCECILMAAYQYKQDKKLRYKFPHIKIPKIPNSFKKAKNIQFEKPTI